MKKSNKFLTMLIILAVILIVAIAFLGISLVNAQNQDNSQEKNYSYTKAICKDGICQDYVVTCNGTKLLSTEPITGASVTVPTNWQDPRNQEMIDKFCNISN